MKANKKIELLRPKPYEQVGSEFTIFGRVHKSCLKTSWGNLDYRVLGGFVDINGIEFASTVATNVRRGLFSRFTKKFYFSTTARFSQFNVPFIVKSQGRIALKLSTGRKDCAVFLPLIVSGFEPKDGADPKSIEKHGKIGKLIRQYEIDLENYSKELEEIRRDSSLKINVTENDEWMTSIDIKDDDLLKGLLNVFNFSQVEFEKQYEIATQARKEQMLAEKYKEAIEWRGPLFRGVVKKWRGFKLKVYSDDHGEHLHVIHGEKGIDARFSFPDIKLIDYKRAKKVITSKEEKQIQALFKNPELFRKLEKEFAKRFV